MQLLLGMILGGLAAWLYSSNHARDLVRQQVASAPVSLQQLRQTAAAFTATGAQRAAEVIDAAPVSERVKETASGAAFNVWAAADKLGQTTPETEASQIPETPADT
jgi:hypothetical protein